MTLGLFNKISDCFRQIKRIKCIEKEKKSRGDAAFLGGLLNHEQLYNYKLSTIAFENSEQLNNVAPSINRSKS